MWWPIVILMSFTVATMTWLTDIRSICVTNNYVHVLFVVITIRSFPHSWLITGLVTRVTRKMSYVQKELLSLPSTWVQSRFWIGFVLLNIPFCKFVSSDLRLRIALQTFLMKPDWKQPDFSTQCRFSRIVDRTTTNCLPLHKTCLGCLPRQHIFLITSKLSYYC